MAEEAPGDEHNKYRDHLVDAKATVTNSVNTWGEDGNPAQSIINHVTSGWQCDEADLWMDEVRAKGLTIRPSFETAESDLTALIRAEPVNVDKGDPHGDAYIR
jgi:hypothetical protein